MPDNFVNLCSLNESNLNFSAPASGNIKLHRVSVSASVSVSAVGVYNLINTDECVGRVGMVELK